MLFTSHTVWGDLLLPPRESHTPREAPVAEKAVGHAVPPLETGDEVPSTEMAVRVTEAAEEPGGPTQLPGRKRSWGISRRSWEACRRGSPPTPRGQPGGTRVTRPKWGAVESSSRRFKPPLCSRVLRQPWGAEPASMPSGAARQRGEACPPGEEAGAGHGPGPGWWHLLVTSSSSSR